MGHFKNAIFLLKKGVFKVVFFKGVPMCDNNIFKNERTVL